MLRSQDQRQQTRVTISRKRRTADSQLVHQYLHAFEVEVRHSGKCRTVKTWRDIRGLGHQTGSTGVPQMHHIQDILVPVRNYGRVCRRTKGDHCTGMATNLA